MRIGLLILLGVSATTARASFDLMLLGDNTTAGSERVVRYDPVNRVVLGSFGTGFINNPVSDIAVDSSTGTAYVLSTGGRVRKFNYNSGAYLGTFTIGSLNSDINFDPNSGLLMGGSGGGSGTSPVRAFSSSGTIVHTYLDRFVSTALLRRPGASWYGGFTLSQSGNFIAATRYNLTGGSPLSGEVAGPQWTGQAPRQAIFTSNGTLLGIGVDLGANTTTLYSVNSNTIGYTSTMTLSPSIGPANANASIVNGHGSLAYILTGNSLLAYDTDPNSVIGSQTLGFATAANIRGMAIVLAPEPGTMIALAAGAAALLRRRRK